MRGEEKTVVLFDGVCNLCSFIVQFIIDRDPKGRFMFAPLQSEAARSLLQGVSLLDATPDSVIVVEGGRVTMQSDAALRVARRLRAPWPLFTVLVVIPRPLRDVIYRWIARHRYRWFGKSESCRIPTPELRRRFLE